jgi:hypothetical protein
MGVVDDAYLVATGDPTAVLGRKVSITASEVLALTDNLRRLGTYLRQQF